MVSSNHDAVEGIIEAVLSDEKLFTFIQSKVLKRLPVAARSDPKWCQKVIDTTIDEAIEAIDLIDLLKTFKTNSLQRTSSPQKRDHHKKHDDNRTINTSQQSWKHDDFGRKTDVSKESTTPNDTEVDETNIISATSGLSNDHTTFESTFRPSFSSSEPGTVLNNSTKRALKILNKNKQYNNLDFKTATATFSSLKSRNDPSSAVQSKFHKDSSKPSIQSNLVQSDDSTIITGALQSRKNTNLDLKAGETPHIDDPFANVPTEPSTSDSLSAFGCVSAEQLSEGGFSSEDADESPRYKRNNQNNNNTKKNTSVYGQMISGQISSNSGSKDSKELNIDEFNEVDGDFIVAYRWNDDDDNVSIRSNNSINHSTVSPSTPHDPASVPTSNTRAIVNEEVATDADDKDTVTKEDANALTLKNWERQVQERMNTEEYGTEDAADPMESNGVSTEESAEPALKNAFPSSTTCTEGLAAAVVAESAVSEPVTTQPHNGKPPTLDKGTGSSPSLRLPLPAGDDREKMAAVAAVTEKEEQDFSFEDSSDFEDLAAERGKEAASPSPSSSLGDNSSSSNNGFSSSSFLAEVSMVQPTSGPVCTKMSIDGTSPGGIPISPGQVETPLYFDKYKFEAEVDKAMDDAEVERVTGLTPMKAKTKAGRRVQWSESIVSEVRTREKCSAEDRAAMFYTHQEEFRFTQDMSKEQDYAEMIGQSWYEWMDTRTDEDIVMFEEMLKARSNYDDEYEDEDGDYGMEDYGEAFDAYEDEDQDKQGAGREFSITRQPPMQFNDDSSGDDDPYQMMPDGVLRGASANRRASDEVSSSLNVTGRFSVTEDIGDDEDEIDEEIMSVPEYSDDNYDDDF